MSKPDRRRWVVLRTRYYSSVLAMLGALVLRNIATATGSEDFMAIMTIIMIVASAWLSFEVVVNWNRMTVLDRHEMAAIKDAMDHHDVRTCVDCLIRDPKEDR